MEFRRTGLCGRYGGCQYRHIPPGQPIPMADEFVSGPTQSPRNLQHVMNDTMSPIRSNPTQPLVAPVPPPPHQYSPLTSQQIPFPRHQQFSLHFNAQHVSHISASVVPIQSPPQDQAAAATALSHEPTPVLQSLSSAAPRTSSGATGQVRSSGLQDAPAHGPGSHSHPAPVSVQSTPPPSAAQKTLLAIFQSTPPPPQTLMQSVSTIVKLPAPSAPPRRGNHSIPDKIHAPVKPVPSQSPTKSSPSLLENSINPSGMNAVVQLPPVANIVPEQIQSRVPEQSSPVVIPTTAEQSLVETPALKSVSGNKPALAGRTAIGADQGTKVTLTAEEKLTDRPVPTAPAKATDVPLATSGAKNMSPPPAAKSSQLIDARRPPAAASKSKSESLPRPKDPAAKVMGATKTKMQTKTEMKPKTKSLSPSTDRDKMKAPAVSIGAFAWSFSSREWLGRSWDTVKYYTG